jgi:hypothetical protein
MLLAGVLIIPTLVTPPLYQALYGSCDNEVDPAADRCAPYSKSRDTVPRVGLILCPINGRCHDEIDHAAVRCLHCSKSPDTAPFIRPHIVSYSRL